MGRLAGCALAAGLALAGAGCASSGHGTPSTSPPSGTRATPPTLAAEKMTAGRGPFVPNGEFSGGSGGPLLGDRVSPGATIIGCVSRRHYAIAITIRNRSTGPVTLTGVAAPDPASQVVSRVAIQLWREPLPPSGDALRVLFRHWSAAPTRPLTVAPGRSAVVQSNFLMRNCAALAGGRTVSVSDSLQLSYRASGRAERQTVTQRGSGFVVSRGPVRQQCAAVPGSLELVSVGVSCAVARQAATACRRMSHGSWGDCTVGHHRWSCSLAASSVEQCLIADAPTHWYRVRWPKRR